MDAVAEPFVHMAGITKTFATGVVANDDANLAVQRGTIHAIVGENGAGKTTLMNVLYGRYRPDAGRIRLDGRDVEFRSPADAIKAGIGMVTQHSTFLPALTAMENVFLGHEPAVLGVLRLRAAMERAEEIAAKLGVNVDWRARAATLSVATLQKAEIIRALYRGARILILDEPTAALAPQEASQLFSLLHDLVKSDHTVLLITHRLREVLEHADRVTVMRAGRTVADMATDSTTAAELASVMVGPSRKVYLATDQPGEMFGEEPTQAPSDRGGSAVVERHPPPSVPLPVLEVRNLTVPGRPGRPGLRDVTLTLYAGEVLGIAGVDGSGQSELCEAIVGLRTPAAGTILLNGKDVTHRPPAYRLRKGLAYCPEDRQRDGLVLGFSVAENLLLGHHREPEHGGGTILNPQRLRDATRMVLQLHHIEAPSPETTAAYLSGGNQQKVVIARCLLGKPSALVAMHLTRGLDLASVRRLYSILEAARSQGLGVLLVSLDLDELTEAADRIAVLFSGRLAGILTRQEMDRDTLGRMMTTGAAH